MQKIILASGSAQRKSLFSVLSVPFEAISADIDEKAIRDNNLKIQAEKIARAKAEKIASENIGIIIAADTFVVLDGQVLEKPKDTGEAKKMLELQSGRDAIVYTGFCYLDAENGMNFSDTAVTNITFRKLSDDEIEEYINKFPVTGWSAAFSTSHLYGAALISQVNGSFTGLTHGLPIELLIPLLKKSGINARP